MESKATRTDEHADVRSASAGCCFEVLTAVESLFTLGKRSETLDGSIPLRAAQGCKPLLEGNAAGFHLRFGLSAVIRKDRHRARLIFTDGDDAKATKLYRSGIKRLAERRLLAKDGFWSRTLRKGVSWQHKNVLYIWTGHLVRPVPGVWILVSGAFNRRCFVQVREYVIPDSDVFVPLVLELDLSSLRDRDTWLDTEVACLTPLRPDVAMSMVSLKDRPDAGRAFCAFYDAAYVEPRLQGNYVGRYRKITASEPHTESARTAECELVVVNGPHSHTIRTFDRFATSRGWSRGHPDAGRLQYAVIRNIGLVKGRWDGLSVRDVSVDVPDVREQLHQEWTALFGPISVERLESLFEYVIIPTPHRGEPIIGIVPRAFAVTPPGWSTLVDSFDFHGLDGMRGLVSTDTYFGTGSFWQLYKPMKFTIPRGANLIRLLPVPRRLLRATFSERPLDLADPLER
jgi:hypothetical protein